MPHSDPQVSAAYKAAWAKTPAGVASKAASAARYRGTAKGLLVELRGAAKRRGQ